MSGYWIGVDIGGTKCAALLATVDGGIHILDKTRFATANADYLYDFNRLCEAIADILARNNIDAARVEAIGVSCGGPLDSKKGIILCPPNLPGWRNVPIKALLEDRFGIPTYIQNDANACALVEWKLGAGKGRENMIFLTMGTGMGAGIIAENRLLRGFSDMCGEVGHIRLTESGPIGYGKEGSFEGYASGGGMMRQAIELTKHLVDRGTPPAWINDGFTQTEIDASLIASYARKGDKDAREFFNGVGRRLGFGLSVLVDILNPEIIVIGSVYVHCEDLLKEAMWEELRREAVLFSLNGLSVVPAATGAAIGDLASIMVALYERGIVI